MKVNFLIIDDSEIDLFVIQKSIEKALTDVEILTFIRANKAIEHLTSLIEHPEADHSFIPDFILVDINMPDVDGFEFLDAYESLKNKKLQKTKVFMVSSSINPKDIAMAESHCACDGYISKPLTIELVQQIVQGKALKIKAE